MGFLDDARSGTLDLLDGDLYVDTESETWAYLRDHEPCYRDERNGLWAITRYEDVVAVEKDAATFCNGEGFRPGTPADDSMISLDDPEHTKRRGLVARRFTPRAVRRHEDEIRAAARALVDRVAPTGRADVVTDLAAPLPAMMITRLLGLPDEAWTKVQHWSESTIVLGGGPRAMNDEGIAAAIDCYDHLGALVEAKRDQPADDVMSVLVHGEIDGCPLSGDQLASEGLLLIDGGAETTRTVIAHTVRALIEHPDHDARLRADPSLLPGAVEEFIRWTTPIVNFRRTATREVELHGRTIAAGDEVLLCYPAANRDPAAFDRPDEFDVTRARNQHLAFGFGTHFCLGASLARLELRIMFEELLGRLHDWRIDGEIVPVPSAFVRGVAHLPIAFRPA